MDFERRLGVLISLPQGGGPAFDAYGVPVQDRPVSGRTNPAVIGFLICAVVSAPLAIVQITYHVVPHALVVIGVVTGALPLAVVGFGGS